MLLKNDKESRVHLDGLVDDYYSSKKRAVRNFLHSEDQRWGTFYSHYLVDRKYVMRCSIGQDRGIYLIGVQLAIGPHYFPPSEF